MKKQLLILPPFLLLFCMHPLQAMNDSLLERRVTVAFTRIPLEEALAQLAAVAQVKFMYSSDQLKIAERVSLKVKDKMLGDVLEELLVPLGVVYKTHEREASITLRLRKAVSTSETHMPILPGAAPEVRGKVAHASGEPMAGVSIYVKGTSRGTTTDAAGMFTLDAQPGEILVISFIGYRTVEFAAGTEDVLNIILEEDVLALDEVMINAGYWEVKDRERTGNISRVTAKDIERQPVSNPLLALQGRMPGVVVTQVSGVPGSGIRLQIRGQNSLRNIPGDNGNLPLYIIDGVPIESAPMESQGALLATSGIDPLNTLNLANIESIDVLKDADATAIYGSRGANGVVLITTRKGKPGNLTADVQAYASAGKVTNTLNLMNTKQYLAMRNEAFTLDNRTPGVVDSDVNGTWSESRYTNWQDKLFGGTATFQDVQASVSGGSAQTTFRAGAGFHRESTVFPGDFGYKKIMGNLNLMHTSRDTRLKLSVSVNYGYDINKLFSRNIVTDALTLAPNAPMYDDAGNLDWAGYGTDLKNPLSYFNITHESNTASLVSNTSLSYEIQKGLRATATFGYTDMHTRQIINTPQTSMNPADLAESMTQQLTTLMRTWITEPQLAYARTISRGRLDALIGTTFQSTNTSLLGVRGTGFVSDGLLGNLNAADEIDISRDDKSEYRYTAVFGRIGYIWDEQYLINLTARRDGSSRFGSNNRFGNFGALGLGWIFSEMTFLKNSLPVLSFGKIRASYGTTGNDRIGNYGYLSTYSPGPGSYSGSSILRTTALANPDFGWEENRKLEAALELGFFKDRLMVTTSWYRNRSSNQLVGYPLPGTSGFTSVQYNLDATVENTGWEFQLNTVNLDNERIRWQTSFNLTVPRNELVSYPGLAGSSYADIYVVGEPLTISKRYKWLGVNETTGRYDVRDADEDGLMTGADRTEIINLGRTAYGGIHNTVTYKGVTLDFLFEFARQKSNDYYSLFGAPPGTMSNQPAFILDEKRWKEADDDATLQRFTQGSRTSYTRTVASDQNVSDASFGRLKTVLLSWTLPSKLFVKTGLRDARVYVQGQNLLTFTKYEGLNPDSPTLNLPPLKTFTVGVALKL